MPMSYFYYVSFRVRRALAVWHLYATYFHHDKFLPYYVSIILRARRKVNFVFAIMCNFFATWKLWALIIFLSRIVYANIRFGCKFLQYHVLRARIIYLCILLCLSCTLKYGVCLKKHMTYAIWWLDFAKNKPINKNICDCISLVRTGSLPNHTMQFECCKRKLA